MVITDLGCYEFLDGEMVLTSLHPGAELAGVKRALGWDVRVAAGLAATLAPTADELRLIREELDPEHLYI
jgi:glutaconate CoA-transferase subunit B